MAPKPLARAYGVDPKNAETVFLVRVFSSRNLTLGALGLAVTDRTSRRKITLATAGLNS